MMWPVPLLRIGTEVRNTLLRPGFILTPLRGCEMRVFHRHRVNRVVTQTRSEQHVAFVDQLAILHSCLCHELVLLWRLLVVNVQHVVSVCNQPI